MSLHVDLSNYEKYLKYRRPEGFEFQYSTDKTYVWVPEGDGFSSGEVVSESGDNVKVRTEKGNVCFFVLPSPLHTNQSPGSCSQQK